MLYIFPAIVCPVLNPTGSRTHVYLFEKHNFTMYYLQCIINSSEYMKGATFCELRLCSLIGILVFMSVPVDWNCNESTCSEI